MSVRALCNDRCIPVSRTMARTHATRICGRYRFTPPPAADHRISRQAGPDAAVVTTNDHVNCCFLLFLRRWAPTAIATMKPTAQEMPAATTISSLRLCLPPPSSPLLQDGNIEFQLVSVGVALD